MAEDKEILINEEYLPENENSNSPNNNPYCSTTISLHLNNEVLPNSTSQDSQAKNVFKKLNLFGKNRNQPKIASLTQIPIRRGAQRPNNHKSTQYQKFLIIFHDIVHFHWKVLLSSLLTLISSAGCIIFFPIHLENITSFGSETIPRTNDSFSAILPISMISTVMILISSLLLKIFVPSHFSLVPISSWSNIFKIGFSLGLSFLTLFYSWENHKVVCNLQDPLLGLVFVFASITHGISKWRELGYRRSFALLTIGAGVFLSVDYQLVDHHRCRGHYESPAAAQESLAWTWQVHLVWTVAFIVSIWLWTIAIFCMESSVSLKLVIRNKRMSTTRTYQQTDTSHNGYNAVKMKVLKISVSDLNGTGSELPQQLNNDPQDIFQLPNYRSRIKNLANNYTGISLAQILNLSLWFHISSFLIIGSLFWTVFIPGFGRGISVEEFPRILENGFLLTVSGTSSWLLIFSSFIFSLAFTYLLLLIRSPIISIGIACLGFPIVGIWWSIVQIHLNSFIWMPMFSGELLCSILGLPLIVGGIWYLFKLDVLKLDSQKQHGSRK